MTNSKAQRGFTLIELLVVVAIIGILATLVLVSLGTVRSRARDARINGAIAQIGTQCEIGADTDTDYRNCLVTDPEIVPLVTDIDTQNGSVGGPPTITPRTGATGYCIEAQLATTVAGTPNEACRDSDGNVTLPSGGIPANVGCSTTAQGAECDGTP